MSGRLDPEPIARRDFLGMAGLGAAFTAILGSLIGMLRLPKPRVTPEASSVVRVGRPEEYTPGTVKTLPEHKVRIMSTDRGIAGISLVCTHLGCIVKDSNGGFSCPCHGSLFGKGGEVKSGPAPRGLRWLAVSRSADGTLLVDTQSDVKPGTFYKV